MSYKIRSIAKVSRMIRMDKADSIGELRDILRELQEYEYEDKDIIITTAHNDTVCSTYREAVLPDEKGNCSLCGAELYSTMFIPHGEKVNCSRCGSEGDTLNMAHNIYKEYTCKTCIEREAIGL